MSQALPLNPAQLAGVEHRGSPLLLLAGAGTGKTRVITHRVAALIDEGVPAWRILAVTFTNKAAGEMRERIAGLLGMELGELRRDGPWIGTFHSICARILRRHGEGVGLSRNFAIYDADDQRVLMRKVLKALNIDPKMFSPTAALGKIDAAKNIGLGRDRLHELGLGQPVEEWTRRAWALYEEQLRAADAADFGDLLTLTVELLRKAGPSQAPKPEPAGSELGEIGEAVRKMTLQTRRKPSGTGSGGGAVDPVVGLRRRFMHVVVDEYQDTNPVQAELVDLLCGARAELCVVGDDDQAIYGWRGADVGQILNFPDKHRGCEVIRLEQNYRSTTRILDCANAVIRSGAARHDKQLWSELGPGEAVEVVGFEDEREEARWAAQAARRAIDEGESPAEIVVFYRTHAQSRPLEEAMRLHGIRYRMLGGIRFYDRREIKDLVAYLRLLTNPGSDLDCLRVINVPARRIGAKTIERLTTWATREGCPLYEACGPRSEHGKAAGLGAAASKSVASFWSLVDTLREDSKDLPHHHIAALILERSGYVESIAEEQDGEARVENLKEFVGALEEFGEEQPEASLAEYLEQISLASTVDEQDPGGAITLMTIHAAKGLEFDRVLLTGMEEGVFPHARALGEDAGIDAIDEERRLAYVALTRARRSLSLSFVRSRFLWGSTQVKPVSRFVRALPEEAVVLRGQAAARKRRERRAPPRPRAPRWDDSIVLDPEFADSRERGEAPSRSRAALGAGGGSSLDGQDREVSVEPTIEYDDEAIDEHDGYGNVGIYQGMRVRHPKFGVGSVLGWSGSGRNMKLTLSFAGERRTILARFCTPA
ncbi:UvrD-helicase domain-containing protein [Pseudenhygromyxa sp. WMMC2535]|uniref:ATP-dependent helicase n=1 Tax=Pseudenhygromyxa sp. WMMC2535 TaxID=2712867 RepID=UPI001553E31A|nr:UvrD-helicase domain-containing protein [Pseudenhygromyxa sp. WMMC2535]NVB38521.1 UvrD-helicase domain-containing protein [Pseudenhygromyxa sp. WMMC2535]